ncbi:MAG TPA: hypothetical protein PKA53_11400, partial [Sphingobacterium sp.]|nr:hypothetical protein [Sphingobacterium sp.]
LNGTHTLTCGLALLANHPFVKTTLEDPVFFKWIQHLIHNEIIPCLIYQGIPQTSIQAFTITLIDRFKNPYLQHQWNSIAINYTAKLKYRVVPMLKVWYTVHHQAPNSFAFGFAVYIYFMKSQLERTQFSLSDPSADRIYIHLQQEDDIINNILADAILWGEDLTVYPSWSKSVKCIFQQLQTQNIQEIIQKQVRDQP